MESPGSNDFGEAVRGDLHTADASAGVEIPLFTEDGTARAIATDEQFLCDSLNVVSSSGGDVRVFADYNNDNVPDGGETLFRGTVAANGGAVVNFDRNTPQLPAGTKPHALAPAGDLDVQLRGRILKVVPKTPPTGAPGHYVG